MSDSPDLKSISARRRPVVAVCGSSAEDAQLNGLAEDVGRLLAAGGATLVCGGGGGVMAAACRGALAAGGVTIGILPGGDPAEANPHVQIAVATGMGHARNAIIVQTADAVIAVGGAYGTLSEIALASACGRPVVGMRTWELGGRPETIHATATPAEAVALALRLAGGGR
ncbi:TIGR00725 family protein [Oscillochloris sp. ZM17-4]|uniref:TIGR00725 family protein n=1 Tax=Oscillochloris sp. ZM17-4 TaxID=2866714 RepID=UPI001C72B758|nr:TIGR00725 family protein [Oscillochloris sp. ZM17-4]MBX0327092.1 TIGR00725 family protein [Oscillochloris sp. ZM17-4]